MPHVNGPFHRRLVPARPDLAAAHLRGRVAAERFAPGRPARVAPSLLDLTLDPNPTGERATQLLHGEVFVVYEERPDGLVWGQAQLDGYVGYVARDGLGPQRGAGRPVTAIWSQSYQRPSVQARVLGELPLLADVPVSGSTSGFARLRDGGHVPLPHLTPSAGDPVAQALRFVGAPYLWGGRSIRGIDCSGLVQIAHLACGVALPRDTDMQVELAGAPLPPDAALARGDLVFWRGHVALMIDGQTLIHANAHHMAVAVERLADVEERVLAARGGPVTARRRP
ncbi:cell wall-associated NlpC family hydrolase [Amaricoccus macauensis]|uniref:Cell wall-associated NlpC family hydrolase n=1 Tax=Amaricoccus macauensis TaxID=57001 RepID=A0A840SPL7_9RHOB|nr:NlpC/P60 family protein [Amaricoccus macauensis]MBB5223967.1 cell wall-associated NlpC family hydrolase [Amaricoccus macauensis]